MSFTDDEGNAESLTSAATSAAAAAEPTEPLPAPRNLTTRVNPDGSITALPTCSRSVQSMFFS